MKITDIPTDSLVAIYLGILVFIFAIVAYLLGNMFDDSDE